jgi:hypothetical protein
LDLEEGTVGVKVGWPQEDEIEEIVGVVEGEFFVA